MTFLKSLKVNDSKTMLQFNNFFPSHIIACTSDRTVDFTFDPQYLSLNDYQKKYLSRLTGFDIPDPVSLVQEHGDKIYLVDGQDAVLSGDGVLTSQPNCALSIRSADCLSIFIWDSQKDCIGLVHAGWKGSLANIARKAIEQMRAQCESNPKNVKIAFGPSICSRCYEVGVEFKQHFPEHVLEIDGKYFLDLIGVNQQQLLDAGIEEENICRSDICTKCRDEYYSYRREGDQAGRMISLMMLKSKAGG